MQYYFILQYHRLIRKLRNTGVNPYLLGVSLISLFITGAVFAFKELTFAAYIISVLGLITVTALSNKERNEFLKNSFSIKDYKKVRAFENTIVAIPFFALLLFHTHITIAFVFLGISILLSLYRKVNDFQFIIPTPFFKYPFEFASGFRKTYLIFLLSYALTAVSISVDNFNLGIFSLITVFLTYMSYYAGLEPLFYVWSYSIKPAQFLYKKVATAIVYSILFSLPIFGVLLWFYPEQVLVLSIFEILGFLILTLIVLSKYVSYPYQLSITNGIVIGFCFMFPPLLLFVIYYFYNRSKNNLKSILK
jgi:hypothetical protein